MKKISAFTFCLLLMTFSHAEIHKCANGFFTEKPCPEGGTGTTIKSTESGASANITFQEILQKYPVHGATYAAVNTAMHKAGPYQGWARWKVVFTFTPKRTGSECQIEDLKIAVDENILMPDWIEQRQAAIRDQNEWDHMYSVLKTHEDGHTTHGREFAILLKQRLLGIGPKPCDQLQKIAENTQTSLQAVLGRRDEEYDRMTEHGLRQFNPQ